MIGKKRFCWCFRGHKAPEITYSLENGLTLQPVTPDIPMPSDPEEVNARFAELVDELDLDKPHRDAMFSLPPEKKWQIYCSKKKEQEDPSSASWPDYYIERVKAMSNIFFSYDEDEIRNRFKFMEGLKTALRTQPMRFVTRFMDLEGVQTILDFLKNMDNDTSQGPIHTEAIGCIKALMNNSHGRAHVLAHPTGINIIAQSLASENVRTRIAVLEILGASCLVPGGHRKVLEAMVHYQKYAAERTRFQGLIYDLDRTLPDFQDEISLKTTIMSFINAALKYGPGADHLEFRMHLRYEFLMLGIMPILDKLREHNNDTLDRHIDFFEMVRNEDEKELAKRFDMNHIDSKSATSMLDLLKKKLGHTLAYPHMLSVLFHLLQLPSNGVTPQYWQLIDRIVQQISLQQKDGSNPDQAPLEINCNKIVKLLASENEIKAVQQKMREIQKENDDIAAKLAKKENECEIKNEEKEELMEMVNKLKSKYEQELCNHSETKRQLAEMSHRLNELTNRLEAEQVERQKFEHLVKTGSLPDDAKVDIKAAASAFRTKSAAFKPVPAAPAAPRPPPPPPGPMAPAAPPPPGAPPLPGGRGMMPGVAKIRKDIPSSAVPLKSFNWTKLPDIKVTGTIWTELNDARMYKVLDLDDFEKNFSAYQRHSSEDDVDAKCKPKTKELSVIDGRRAQNCTILLSKLKMTNDEIAKAVMSMDSQEELPKDMCEQLLKFVPTPEERSMLVEHEHEIDEMAKADRFLFEMGRIEHYEQRLKALYYKKKFSERMSECKPKVDSVLKGSTEVVRSRKLKKLLEIVLAYGNYMNRGQRGNANGFRLNSLNKIIDTKSCQDRKITFLHYLSDVLQRKFPDVTKLEDDIPSMREAAKVSLNDLDVEIAVLRNGLKEIEAELAFHSKRPFDRRDKFVSVMKNFNTVASINLSELEEVTTEMKSRFEKALKCFGEEQGKMQPDEFFGMFEQFLTSYDEAKRENARFKRAQDEEEKRIKNEAQMKSERARRTLEKQRSLGGNGKANANGYQNGHDAGEFDSLVSALRSGDVFGEDMAKMKRNRRRGSAQTTMERERVGNIKALRKHSEQLGC